MKAETKSNLKKGMPKPKPKIEPGKPGRLSDYFIKGKVTMLGVHIKLTNNVKQMFVALISKL